MTALHQIETKLSQTSLTLRAPVFSMETIMVIKAKNLQDAEELLHSGINKVELAYDIGSDDFFRLASPGAIAVRASPKAISTSWCRLKAWLFRQITKSRRAPLACSPSGWLVKLRFPSAVIFYVRL